MFQLIKMISKIVNTFITVVNTNACAICKYFHPVLRQREKVGKNKKIRWVRLFINYYLSRNACGCSEGPGWLRREECESTPLLVIPLSMFL